uniref:Ig-like domain-containing protein n=1 Tax=Oryzias melastigma TaxID=30732 RepID=A0A3B3DM85_ORYME
MNSSSEVTSSDRVQITDGGSTLTVVDVTRYDEQSYRCRVFNPVSEGISDPVNILVSCEFFIFILSFSYDVHVEKSRTWKKDGSDLNLSENVTLSEDNTVLTFKAVKKENSGEYVCLVSNPVSNGPANIKLICSAESTPSATFTWRLNGSEIIGSSAEFLKEKAHSSDSGTYTCEAKNTVTEKQSTTEWIRDHWKFC